MGMAPSLLVLSCLIWLDFDILKSIIEDLKVCRTFGKISVINQSTT